MFPLNDKRNNTSPRTVLKHVKPTR